GIESSYRQLGECLAVTTSKDERVRLLWVGLSLMLRQYGYQVRQWQGGGGRQHRLRQGELAGWLILGLAPPLALRPPPPPTPARPALRRPPPPPPAIPPPPAA